MENNEYRNTAENYTLKQTVASQQATFIAKVYMWMSLALAITGLAAYYTATSEPLLNLMFKPITGAPTFLFYALIIGELALVFWLSAAINKMTLSLATAVFLFYSLVNGMTLSMIFIAYTMSSIATTFFITAGTFAIMSAYGYFTKTDLTKMGKILFMALIGIVLATIVNIFLHNGTLNLIISIVGVLVFVGLIAYDTQKIKEIGATIGENGTENYSKGAIMGALSLYLDFINLFLFLLRFLGDRR
ncbi:Bax inhibitor-1/YccA family protein [Apibacter muscae]|uniref:Bax inhibitor-1/YccA family protein n=1 Tax=Apibacter muscae TaxID=2509004 RepID=A0A563DH25_9FLAO|nr:Bax inhibitor-1/YccA family protein [Apibacter muscae]TWP24267.1 Bax inhibitor-1/YccA family protein [Apibacter muscae]TWP29437.1 Bax inhibitor-1/YccA family protein [Apibacter muscae]TWP30172.1 Bax inhibitor-1/YccA family protein [Apibacter muscae]